MAETCVRVNNNIQRSNLSVVLYLMLGWLMVVWWRGWAGCVGIFSSLQADSEVYLKN